jgi:hypothetical protein
MVIEAWSTDKERLKLEDIDCDGCTVGKRLYKFCSVCEAKNADLKKALKTVLTVASIHAKNLNNFGIAFEQFLQKKQKRI